MEQQHQTSSTPITAAKSHKWELLINEIFPNSITKKENIIQSLILCRELLDSQTQNEKDKLLEIIWLKIINTLPSSLMVLCFLLDYFLANQTICYTNKISNELLKNELVQKSFLSIEDENLAKYSAYILRRIGEKNDNWITFFIIIDTLIEKQSHLILPVLKLLPKTIELSNNWHFILLAKILETKNSLVLQRIVHFILSNDKQQQICANNKNDEGDCFAKTILLERFLLALNNTTLYQHQAGTTDEFSFETDLLAHFLDKRFNENKILIKLIDNIPWKPVPFYYLCDSISKLTIDRISNINQLELIEIFVNRAKIIPNLWLRNICFHRLQNLYTGQCKFDENYKKIIGLISEKYFLNSQFIDCIEIEHFYDKTILKMFDNNEESDNAADTQQNYDPSIITEIINNILLITDKYLLIKNMHPDELELNVKKLLNLYLLNNSWDWLICHHQNLINNDLQLNQLILKKSNYYLLRQQIIVNTFILNTISLSTRSLVDNIKSLINYHLRLAFDLIKYNLSTFNNDELNDLLHECFIELNSSKQDNLIYGFLNILEKLPNENKFLAKITEISKEKSKWRYILINYYCKNKKNFQFMCEHLKDFIYESLIFGVQIKGDQRIELELCQIVYGENLPNECIQSVSIRSKILNTLNNTKLLFNIEEISINLWTHLTEKCFIESNRLYETKPRYYADSEYHRLKLRILQTLAMLFNLKSNCWDQRFAEILLNENNQLNIIYILECIIAKTISTDDVFKLLEKTQTPLPRRSIFMIIWYICCNNKTNKLIVDLITKSIESILPWTMGKDFHTRILAQIIIKKLIKLNENCDESFKWLLKNVEKSLNNEDHLENVEKIQNDFRFNIKFINNLNNLIYYLYEIPKLTDMATNEIIPLRFLKLYDDNDKTNEISFNNEYKVIKLNNSLMRTEYVELNVDNVQKKIVPIKEIFPEFSSKRGNDNNDESDGNDGDDDDKLITKQSGLIVVASLISKPANLGGLSRTCEIFGAEKLILDSLKHLDHQDFQALSMTSEKWLQIGEIKPFHLIDYLVHMKNEGYSIVGAEQTANGVSMTNFVFPQKCILLLGHEKEGIPVNLLSLLDKAVEIPQCGIIRSLNVHVTGALFIWEYAKQHKFK